MNEPHICPLCGKQMYPLDINGGWYVMPEYPPGDFLSAYRLKKTPEPVYFRNQQVTLYACELCGMVKMFKEEQYGCR